jgi:hypothetical protein
MAGLTQFIKEPRNPNKTRSLIENNLYARKIWLNSRLAGFVRLDEKAIQSTKQSSAAREGEEMDSIGGCTWGLAASVRQPSFQSPAFALLFRR